MHRSLPSAAECRALARAFNGKATEAGLPARTATILKSISRSLSALASQLEMLGDTAAAKPPMSPHGP
ncbi:hypothetical protein [Bradyrhizobium sp. B117]|uniref:hypothetical protein n=1 Tax=Bradyrhizobium sp. B117 TaxID=3140246 RepID=UPI003183B2E3